MRTIQEVGSEILSRNPKSFYVFLGEEYGIKEKYIDVLKSVYSQSYEYDSVSQVLDIMSKNSLIPSPPALYIVRYDDTFVSKLDVHTSDKISKMNIRGTIICVYESKKQSEKISKYLSNYAVFITPVDKQHVKKYLREEYPSLPNNLIDLAADTASTYGQSKRICGSLNSVSIESLCKVDASTLAHIVGCREVSTDTQIRVGVAARDFQFLMHVLDTYEGTPDTVLYDILNTLLELEKLMSSRSKSDLSQYMKCWSLPDIYNMFINTYEELRKLRSLSYDDAWNGVVYVLALLQFSYIPSLEDMKC